MKEADDYDDAHTEKVNDQIPGTSGKRVLILAKADGVPETRRAYVEIMLNAMNFCELQEDFQLCDLKMLIYMLRSKGGVRIIKMEI